MANFNFDGLIDIGRYANAETYSYSISVSKKFENDWKTEYIPVILSDKVKNDLSFINTSKEKFTVAKEVKVKESWFSLLQIKDKESDKITYRIAIFINSAVN